MEWTYNRMLETLLKHRFPHDLRALLTHFDAVPSGVHVLKHIPLQSHYADETVIEVSKAHQLKNLRALCLSTLEHFCSCRDLPAFQI